MSLNQKDILKILKLPLEIYLDKIYRQGKKYASVERVELIHRELCDNKEEYFGLNYKELDIDYRNLRNNIRRMLHKNSPEKLSIVFSQQNTSGDLNMSSQSMDLNDSLMSVDSQPDFDLCDPLFKLSKKSLIEQLKQAQQTIIDQEKELEMLKPIGNFFVCEQKRGAFTYGPKVDRLIVSLLCQGDNSQAILRFFASLVREFPVMLITESPDIKKKLPQKSYINSLRDIVPDVLTSHLAYFLETNETKDQRYTLSVDQTTISKNCGTLGMGLINQAGNYHYWLT